jgi:drug/metabolite transporter (DMT)-like permease
MNWAAVTFALASAALFGASTPAAKVLLGSVSPAVLAGLMYCGAGAGVSLLRWFRSTVGGRLTPPEAALSRAELPWLLGAILAGGVVGPLLLMTGLALTDASAASLLLTLESAATALLAWFVFHESFDRRIALGLLCLVAGAIVLSWSAAPTASTLFGPLAIIGACVAWGLDNNLTRKIAFADPLQIVALKGLVAGPINLLLGLWLGGAFPDVRPAFIAGVIGFFCYGLSLALFVVSLRHLGAARTGAYFATAPFFGAVLAVVALGEPVTTQLILAGALMGIGVWLHVTERHEHEHLHEPMTHSHAHSHDEIHQHDHEPADPAGEPHTHRHQHSRVRHSHQHMPDMHHGHRH